MQYLGGKYYIAKRLRVAMEPYIRAHDYQVWEPFCGGLNLSRLLADCRGLLSDAHPALISLYLGYRAGWRPPGTVSREEWLLARSLPDTDPLKAFIGFGCSVFGKYFAGYLGDRDLHRANGVSAGKWFHERPARATAKSLTALDRLPCFSIVCGDFLEPDPIPTECLIYCDPPYAGTTGYSGTPAFDHPLFWERCQEWARYTTVLVSEQVCPVPTDVIWEYTKSRYIEAQRSGGVAPRRAMEYLFRVLPVPAPTIFDLCPAR
jgi:DNA adenine methylase